MIELSAANLLRNKSRTLLTVIGITLGVAAIISLVSISGGISNTASSVLSSNQYIMIMQEGAFDDTASHLPIEKVDDIRRVRGVKAVTSQISFIVNSFNGQELSASSISQDMKFIQVIGIEPENAELFKNSVFWFNVKRGRMLLSGETSSVLVSTEFAEQEGLFIGSVVEVNGENFRVVGMFDLGTSLGSMNAGIIVMDLSKARAFSGYGDDEIGYVQVLPEDLSEVDKLISRLKDSVSGVRVFSSQQATQMLGSFLGSLTLALWIVSGIAAIVGGIGVMNTTLMSVMERIKEFGVLKAVGWKTSHVVLMVIYEALLIGLLGGVSGVFIGFIGSFLVQLLSGIPTFVSPILIIQVLIFSGGIGVVSAIYPAFVAAGMSPVEAVTYE